MFFTHLKYVVAPKLMTYVDPYHKQIEDIVEVEHRFSFCLVTSSSLTK